MVRTHRPQDLHRIRLDRDDLQGPDRRRREEWGIRGTTTKAIAIGAAVREAQRRHEDPVAAILAAEPGKLLYKGKVIDVARRTTDGYLRGIARSTDG